MISIYMSLFVFVFVFVWIEYQLVKLINLTPTKKKKNYDSQCMSTEVKMSQYS